MGFASAFASGLIKGFHQNILNEQKARAKDEEKLDGYRQLLMKSVLSGDDVNTSAINAVKDMIKSGEKQLEDREGIDIFGRPSERLKIDMLDMAGFVNGTNDTIMIGSVAFPKPKNYDDKSVIGKPNVRATMFLDKMNELGPDKISSMFKTKEDKVALSQFYKNALINKLTPQVVNQATGKIIRYIDPNDDPIHNRFKQVIEFLPSDYQVAREKLTVNNDIREDEIIIPRNLNDGSFTTTTLDDLEITKEELGSLTSIAELQGFNDVREFIFTAGKQYNDARDFIKSIDHTVALFNRNAHNPKNQEDMVEAGKYIYDNGFAEDPIGASNMLVPLTIGKKSRLGDTYAKLGFKQILDERDFNKDFKRIMGLDLKEHRESVENLNRVDRQLRELKGKMIEASLKSGSTLASIFTFFDSIFGATGMVDQAFDLIGGVNENNRAAIKARFDTRFEKAKGEGVLQAQIATLKFVIAADLARAEDSQGRLSDQDLARNLAKLDGFGFTTKEAAISSIGTLQEDIKNKILQKNVINKVIRESLDQGYVDANGRRLLAADKMQRDYLNAYYDSADFDPTTQKPKTVSSISYDQLTTSDEFRFDPDIRTKTGFPVYSDKSRKNYYAVGDDNQVIKLSENSKQLRVIQSQRTPDGKVVEGDPFAPTGDEDRPTTQTNTTTSPPPPPPASGTGTVTTSNPEADGFTIGSDGLYTKNGIKYRASVGSDGKATLTPVE